MVEERNKYMQRRRYLVPRDESHRYYGYQVGSTTYKDEIDEDELDEYQDNS